jgi:hypothetical protein
LGIEIGHGRNIVSFARKQWLKPYIDFNIVQRKDASNGFENDFKKIINNRVFGKTMKNVRMLRDLLHTIAVPMSPFHTISRMRHLL